MRSSPPQSFMHRKCAVIIVAAGRGARAGQSDDGPKQYRHIGGVPIVRRTLDIFASWQADPHLIIIFHEDDKAFLETALEGFEKERIHLVKGGATRQQSVLCGLKKIADLGSVSHVMIHDAVRPFIDHDFLNMIANQCDQTGLATIPALAVADTLKKADDRGQIVETIDRSGLFCAQTPQTFLFNSILSAHLAAEKSGRTDFTDDASIAEWSGMTVALVNGRTENVKLTYQKDIEMACRRMETSTIDIRCGNGYDVHRLVPGDGVTLCGIFIPHDQRLEGHSDADVAFHALTDALLATIGAGDIGDHFPPSDSQWAGASSHIFLQHAVNLIKERGGRIMNADISLIAEAPKIAPFRQKMCVNLSTLLDISLYRCSVKATTNEKLGFVGRKEGIAAIATATIAF